MRVLFIGDIVGKPGRAIVKKAVPVLRDRESLDFVVANGENAAGGSGLTPANYREIIAAGVDGITLGDHVYRRREIFSILEGESNIVKPANLPAESIGRTWAVLQNDAGQHLAICCALGQLFMKPVDSPFRAIDFVLTQVPSDVKCRLVDFHAEATSEMQLMGRYLDGRVSAVLGTHTHVATADEEILPGGTAFQCDVGMTGPRESIIGRRIDNVLKSTLTGHPLPFDVASHDVRLCGTIVDIDEATGRALSVRRVEVKEGELPPLS